MMTEFCGDQLNLEIVELGKSTQTVLQEDGTRILVGAKAGYTHQRRPARPPTTRSLAAAQPSSRSNQNHYYSNSDSSYKISSRTSSI